MTAIDGILTPKKASSISTVSKVRHTSSKTKSGSSYVLLETSIDQLINWVSRTTPTVRHIDTIMVSHQTMGVTSIPVSNAVKDFGVLLVGSQKIAELTDTLRFYVVSLSTWILFAINTIVFKLYIAAHELVEIAQTLPSKARKSLLDIQEISYILQSTELRQLVFIEWKLSFKLFARKVQEWTTHLAGLSRQFYLSIMVAVSLITLGISSVAAGSSSFLQSISSKHAIAADMPVYGVGGSSLISRDILKLRKAAPRSFILEHKVENGQTVPYLAALYGVKPETITFNNSVSGDTLTPDTNIYIPPLDSYLNISSEETTITELSRIYKVDSKDIVAYNPSMAASDTVAKGTVVLVPVSDFGLVKQYQTAEADRIKEVAAQQAVASFRAQALAGAAYKKLDFLDSSKVADLDFGLPVGDDYNAATTYYGHINNAVDFGARSSNPSTYSISSGTVIEVKSGCSNVAQPCYAGGNGISQDNPWYGNFVTVDHGGGYRSRYAHLKSLSVNLGDKVQKGQELGLIGNSGFSYGNHLHFEILKQDGSNWYGVFPPYVIPAIRMR